MANYGQKNQAYGIVGVDANGFIHTLNGSQLTNLTAANLIGVIPYANLPVGSAMQLGLVQIANTLNVSAFGVVSLPQAITTTSNVIFNQVTATVVGNATSATNLAGGTANSLPYQTGSGTTSFLAQGTGILQENAGAPSWTTTPTFNGSNVTNLSMISANLVSNSNISGTFSAGSFTAMPNTAIDGVTPTTNMIILLQNQTSALQNGLYLITSVGTGANGTWTRLTTSNTDSTIRQVKVYVQSGTTYFNTWWANSNYAAINVNTDAINFVQDIINVFSVPDAYLAATLNITTLSGSQTIDGAASGTNVFVLLTAQSTASQNGIWWIPLSGAWVRPNFFTGLISSGMFVNVRYTVGGQNNGIWQIINGTAANATINVGTDNITCNHVASEALQSAWTNRNTASNLPVLSSSGLINNFQLGGGFTTTVTAAGTTTLTIASTQVQQFTGTNTQTLVLPQANTFPAMIAGNLYTIENLSTGAITVNANGGGLITTVAPGTDATVILTSAATSAGTWHISNLVTAKNTTWTPADASGATLIFTGVTATYSAISNQYNFTVNLTYPTTLSVATAAISGLPATAHSITAVIGINGTTIIGGTIAAGASTITLNQTNLALTGATITISGTYSN